MSHFFHVVLVRPSEPDAPMSESAVKAVVKALMEPYDESIEVASYRDYLDDEDIARLRKHYEEKVERTLSLNELAEYMPDWYG